MMPDYTALYHRAYSVAYVGANYRDGPACVLAGLLEVTKAAEAYGRALALAEAGDICQSIQDDVEFPESGRGIVAAKLIIRAIATRGLRDEHGDER